MSESSEQVAMDLATELEQASTMRLNVVVEFVVRGMIWDMSRDVLIQVLRDYGEVTGGRE